MGRRFESDRWLHSQKTLLQKFIIRGGRKISGKIRVTGSKNATLPIMAASLLTDQPTRLDNVPDIEDIHTMRELLHTLGAQTSFNTEKHTLVINPPAKLRTHQLNNEHIKKMRASVLLIGPVLARAGQIEIPYPGGCVLGKRSIDTHLKAFEQLGCQVSEKDDKIEINARNMTSKTVILSEMSVTATENILITAALLPGATTIYLAATEPHVQDLCHFLQKMGVQIQGIGTNTITVIGKKALKGARHEVTGDYLQAGTFAIAALITAGQLKIDCIDPHQLDIFLKRLEDAGATVERGKRSFTVRADKDFTAVSEIKTAVHPGFPTDLQAPFMVLMSQAKGSTRIFETLFDGRLNYLYELEKMGAKIEIQNPHQAFISGPAQLQGTNIASCDIRAGAAMVIAALAAKGTTEISDINYIDRGYEKLDQKLTLLGADIRRV